MTCEREKRKNGVMTDIETDIVHLPQSQWKENPADGRPPHHCEINFSTSWHSGLWVVYRRRKKRIMIKAWQATPKHDGCKTEQKLQIHPKEKKYNWWWNDLKEAFTFTQHILINSALTVNLWSRLHINYKTNVFYCDWKKNTFVAIRNLFQSSLFAAIPGVLNSILLRRTG